MGGIIRERMNFAPLFLALALGAGCAPGSAPVSPSVSPVPLIQPKVSATPIAFQVPGRKERLEALGDLAGVSKGQRGFFSVRFFQVLKAPKPRDWLSEHLEKGQTFAEFAACKPTRPQGRTIYLRPIGRMEAQTAQMRAYLEAFYGVQVVMSQPLDAKKLPGRFDIFTKKRQLLAPEILRRQVPQLRPDALCELAITNWDLYPSEDANFVFGLALQGQGVGVFSFARYDPAYFGDVRPAGWEKVRLRRSCKLVAHESCHVFGMSHCVYYNCLLNGVNHLDELDSRSFFLCPVCLRKFYHRFPGDLGRRTRALEAFCRQHGLDEEASWLARF